MTWVFVIVLAIIIVELTGKDDEEEDRK